MQESLETLRSLTQYVVLNVFAMLGGPKKKKRLGSLRQQAMFSDQILHPSAPGRIRMTHFGQCRLFCLSPLCTTILPPNEKTRRSSQLSDVRISTIFEPRPSQPVRHFAGETGIMSHPWRDVGSAKARLIAPRSTSGAKRPCNQVQ